MVRRERIGSEPANARSAYGLRAVLAALGVGVAGLLAVAFGLRAADAPAERGQWVAMTAVLAVLAVAAAVDLVVVLRRLRNR